MKEGVRSSAARTPARDIQAAGRHVGREVRQLDDREPRLHVDRARPQGLVRHGLLSFGSRFYYDLITPNPSGRTRPAPRTTCVSGGSSNPTGSIFPSETSGLIPDPAWASSAKDSTGSLSSRTAWVPGDDILTMIGQGYVQVTPMQMAVAYSAIANGGHLCTPHVVDQIVDPRTGTSRRRSAGIAIRPCRTRPTELSYIRGALRERGATGGTATCAFAGFPLSQVAVAGKTGTAERTNKQDTSWFASMVGPNPDKPDYVIVDDGGAGRVRRPDRGADHAPGDRRALSDDR